MSYFSESDIEQIKNHELTLDIVNQQLHDFVTGFPYANIESEEDITRKIKRIAINKEKIQSTYLAHTNMNAKQLKSFMNNEYGFLDAPKCLTMGLCDWIIGEDGILIGRKNNGRTK